MSTYPAPVIRFLRTERHAIALVDFNGFQPVAAEVVCKITGSPLVGRIDRDSDWFLIPVRLKQSVYAGDTYNVVVHVPGMSVAGRIIRFKNVFAERQFPMCKCPLGIGTDYNDGIFALSLDHAHGNPARQSFGLKMVAPKRSICPQAGQNTAQGCRSLFRLTVHPRKK